MPKINVLNGEDIIDLKKENNLLRKQINDYKSNHLIKPLCVCCGKSNDIDSFYDTKNPLYKSNNGKLPYCKECVQREYDRYFDIYKKEDLAIYYLCRELNLFFSKSAYDSAHSYTVKTQCNIVQSYMKIINMKLTTVNYGTSFNDTKDFLDIEDVERKLSEKKIYKSTDILATLDDGTTILGDEIDKTSQEYNKQNKEDCIRLIGYDPFETENIDIKSYLYNTLINYLTDSTLEDSFKLSSCIEIVKMFGQAEQYNKAISNLSQTSEDLVENAFTISKLTTAKTKLTDAALKLAKDNGISELNSTTKAVGAGTLSGKLKKLNELDLREIEVNKFDVDTCEGFRQIEEINIDTILSRLNLKEDELYDMLAEQTKTINMLRNNNNILTEEVRLARLKLFDNQIDYTSTILEHENDNIDIIDNKSNTHEGNGELSNEYVEEKLKALNNTIETNEDLNDNQNVNDNHDNEITDIEGN